MKKALTKISNISRVWHYVGGKRVDGPPTNLSGDVSGLIGDVDDCDLTQSERERRQHE